MFFPVFAIGFSPGPLYRACTDTAISGALSSQGSLFGVLGEWTAGAGADVSVLCVVSEPESDWDSFQKKSCRSGQQRCRLGLIASCCGILESTCVFSGRVVFTVF